MNEDINFEIEEIQKYLKELSELKFKDFDDFKKRRVENLAASMCIFSMLNSSIELGEILITLKNLETPLKYREIFEILVENKVLSKKTGTKLRDYIYIRNMIAHQYGKIDLKKLYDVVNEKEVFADFIEEVKGVILQDMQENQFK